MGTSPQIVAISRRGQWALLLAGLIVAAGGIWPNPNVFFLASLVAASGLVLFSREPKACLLAALVAGIGGIPFNHDAFLVAALFAAAGLIRLRRGWRAVLPAVLLPAAALAWSWLDQNGCSMWWRAAIVYRKSSGALPYLGWDGFTRAVLWPCAAVRRPDARAFDRVRPVEQKSVNGREWNLYETDLGRFWLPSPGQELLTWLVWEMTVQSDYESAEVAIRPGDTVIDCGAHVGVFSQYALRRGAGRVIAIEPDPTNLACLEVNLAREIASGSVTVIEAGVWDQPGHLTLSHVDQDSARDSFVRDLPNSEKISGLPVRPLDEMLKELKLERVDFIKMDIEGAERRALQGAGETLRKFRPRLAVASYHLPDDPVVIPAVVKKAEPSYEVHAKDVEFVPRRVTTKVLFFH